MNDRNDAAGLVIGAFSRRMRLKLADHSIVEARIKGKKLRPVCGDRVSVDRIPDETDWLITKIHPRDNELTRPDSRGRKEVLAANLDCIVVMAATEPKPDWFVVDRYLVAAENMSTPAIVVFNKTDLLTGENVLPTAIRDYSTAKYTVIKTSAQTGRNLDQLNKLIAGKTSIVVGQSGVGKSSVINQLIDDGHQLTATLSRKHGEGRHTTVVSIMLELQVGGYVVDSPGVRDYAPAIVSADEVIRGYREINDTGDECRFGNCKHLREPDCAVKQALEYGTISARRYESYKRLMSSIRDRNRNIH